MSEALQTIMESRKATDDLKAFFQAGSREGLQDIDPPRVLVQWKTSEASDQETRLPEVLTQAIHGQSELAGWLPPGLERLVELKPSLEELVVILECPLVTKVQTSRNYSFFRGSDQELEQLSGKEGGDEPED